MGKVDNFKITRRGFLTALCGGVGLTLAGKPVFGAERLCYEYLMVNLYPKTEAEKEYLEHVIELVHKRVIPEKAVYVALKYSVQKRKAERFFYFAETLPILCKRMGVTFPLKKPTRSEGE